LSILFNLCIETGKIPDEWKLSHIKLLYKGKGDILALDSYRGIALNTVIRKLFSIILNKRLYRLTDNVIPEEQFGFRAEKGTLQAVKILCDEIDTALSKAGGKLYAVFVDFKSAFDRVNRRILIDKLKNLNLIPIEMLNILCTLLDANLIQINDGLQLSSSITQSNGVLQGDPISPLLFNLLTSDIKIALFDDNNKDVKLLMYADDLVLYSKSLFQLQYTMIKLKTWCDTNNLTVNVGKTKIMKFRKGGNLAKSDKLIFNGVEIEFVNEFKYLGVTFQCRGSFTKHIKNRCASAIKAIHLLPKLANLSISCALKLFELKIAPIASYGIEVLWQKLKTSDLNILESVKATYLKKTLCLSKYTRSRLVYELIFTAHFVGELESKFELGQTDQFMSFIHNNSTKRRLIDRDFYNSDVFKSDEWKKPLAAARRQVLTRLAVHGFHHCICSNKKYHLEYAECVCSLCGQHCSIYHITSCIARTKSIADYASNG
jgi:hypothetical protein